MNLAEMIYRRKSGRSFTQQPVAEETIEKIKEFVKGARPLYEDIKIRAEIVKREDVKCILPWITPQLIAVFSEDKEGFLENVGFIFQQLDLYMQSLGLGVCWLGMGRMSRQYSVDDKGDGMQFVIMLAFGYPKGEVLRRGREDFKRHKLSDIADVADERLEPARLAPSSVNSQPWYFVHDKKAIHTYCIRQGLLHSRMLGDMNRIDMGICLAHMYVANAGTFEFFKTSAPAIKGYGYVGSFTIG